MQKTKARPKVLYKNRIKNLHGGASDIKAVGVKLTLPNQGRHGLYLDVSSDAEHLISAQSTTFEIGDFAPHQFPHVIEFVIPAGIGDASWAYSKICHLKQLTGHEVIVYVCGDEPRRAADFVRMLPNVRWGGYANIPSWNCVMVQFQSDWMDHLGLDPFVTVKGKIPLSANVHLERGVPLMEWLPKLPTDYHYKINIPPYQIREADKIIRKLPRPIIAVYTSNRDKDAYVAGGWNLWSTEQWSWLIHKVMKLPECRGGSVVLIGADYDKNKTRAVAASLNGCAKKLTVIGKHLGYALRFIQQSDYFFSYPSGLGILANVLRVPTMMLLPWILKNLEKSYADPQDIAAQRYRAWADAKPEEVLDWFKRIALPQVVPIWTRPIRNIYPDRV